MQPNEIQVTLTGTPQLAACGGTYVKYYLTYEEGKTLEGHYQCNNQDPQVTKHAM